MATTMDAEPWEYIDVLNECLRIILTIALGATLSYFNIFDATTFVPVATRFVFHVALPSLVIRGLGIGIDFYDNNFSWNFIVVFLILRAVALVVAIGWVYWFQGGGEGMIGQVAVVWLSLTWISTVILGIPISKAVFGSDQLGMFYGLLAGISSFIFQLPLLLFFLECHALDQEIIASKRGVTTNDVGGCIENDDEEPSISHEVLPESGVVAVLPPELAVEEIPEIPRIEPAKVVDERSERNARLLGLVLRRDVWVRILTNFIHNPVVLGIVCGFILTLSTLGPRFLNPKSDEYIPGLGWFWFTTLWLGDCVSPVSLFAMGVWMQDSGIRKLVFSVPIHTTVIYMLSKLMIVPLIMVGLASAINLGDDNAGRAAVLIAVLPISMASFTFGSKYQIGESILSTNVALGTALLLPTIIIWNVVLDAWHLFPITKVPVL